MAGISWDPGTMRCGLHSSFEKSNFRAGRERRCVSRGEEHNLALGESTQMGDTGSVELSEEGEDGKQPGKGKEREKSNENSRTPRHTSSPNSPNPPSKIQKHK